MAEFDYDIQADQEDPKPKLPGLGNKPKLPGLAQPTVEKKNQVGSVSSLSSKDISTPFTSELDYRNNQNRWVQAPQQPGEAFTPAPDDQLQGLTIGFKSTDARVGGEQISAQNTLQEGKILGRAALLGLSSVASGTLKSIGVASKELDFFNEYKDKTAQELGTYKLGTWLDETVKDLVGDLTPEEQGRFSVKLAQGVGNMVGFVAGGAGGRLLKLSPVLTTAALGAATQGLSEYESALAQGATPEMAAKVFWINNLIGTTEALPIMGAFRKLDKYTGGLATGALAKRLSSTAAGRLTNEVAQGFIEESVQEATTQILSNVTAKNTYDATRKIFDDVLEAGAIGGIIGSTMTGVLSAIREKRASGNLTHEEDAYLDKAEKLATGKIEEAKSTAKKEVVETKETDLLSKVKEKANFKDGDLQYYVDKAGEDPKSAREAYGKEVADELLSKVPTEKLKDNFDKAVEMGMTDTADAIGKELDARETKSPPSTPSKEVADESSEGLKLTDKTKDILDEVTDEKIGEKKYQDFTIDFNDGARAFGTIEDGAANISGINAPKNNEGVIRGTKTYERVLAKLQEKGVKTVNIKLQSVDSGKAIDKLVERGILINPRNVTGSSGNERATTFDISESSTPQAKEPSNPPSKTVSEVGDGGVAKDKTQMDDRELQGIVGRDVFKQIERAESQLGEGIVDRNRLIETAKSIQKVDKKDKLLPEHVFEALQYETGYPDNWQDLRDVVKKGGIDINSDAIERQIEVGVDLPKDIVEKFKESKRYKDAIKNKPQLIKAVDELLNKGEKSERSAATEDAQGTEADKKTTQQTENQVETEVGKLPTETKIGKYEAKARAIANKINKTELPSWLKADLPEGTQKQGVGADDVKKALAAATIKMGQLLDKGVEFSQAVKEAVKDLVALYGEGSRDAIEKGFADDYKKETGYNDVSGIKKALVSDEIVKGVDMERIGDNEMMAMGRKILDSGEVNPEALVQKIITEKQGVLKPAEVVALITYKRDIDNKVREVYKEINAKKEAGEDVGTLEVEAKDLERQQEDYDVMSVITAQQQSLAFRLRQKLLDRDYNIVTQIEKYKANNNGYIPQEVEEKFRDLDKKIKAVKDRLWDIQQMRELQEARDAVNNIKEDIERELQRKAQEPQKEKSLADKALAALDKIQQKIRNKTYSDVTLMTPIIDAGITAIKKAIKAGKSIAEAVENGIAEIRKLMKAKGITEFKEDEFRKDMIDGFESEGISTKKKDKEKAKPTINDDGTVTIPNQLIRDLVEKGVTDINDLTDAVHKEVSESLPDITKRQVRDYITGYGRQVNPTADKIQQQVNTAKRIGKLISEVEDLQNKKAKTKDPSTKAKITEKERELKRKIRSLEKDAGIEREELTDAEKLSRAKQNVKNRIAELERKIKNKDFAKKKKLPDQKDDELISLEAEKEKLQNQFDEEQYKLELKNRTGWQKAEDIAKELTSGVVRTLVASWDLSAGLVQGLWRVFTNPVKSIKAFGVMFHHLVSEKGSEQYLAKLKASEKYPLMQASKLAIDDKSGHVSAKEGMFISNWIKVIWDKAIAPTLAMPISIATKGDVRKAYDIAKRLDPYTASQRAFDGYVNSIRVQSFAQLAKSLEHQGYKFESDPKVFIKAADFVNTTTGRGSLGKADASSSWLNLILFAPRKVISEVKLFTPYAFAYYGRMPPAVRKKALVNFATFAGSFITVNALLHAMLKGEDDDEKDKGKLGEFLDDNFWNPNSTDFLTHKIGDKRISIGGGMKSMLTFQSRFWTGTFVDQYGNESKLGDRYGKQINTRFDLLTNFLAGKASPTIGAAIKKAQERKGLEIDKADMIKNLTVPIWMQDLKDLYKTDPASVNTILTAISIFGANMRTVQDSKKHSPFTEEDKKDPVFKYFLDKDMELPNVVPASIDVPDKATHTMKNLTEFTKEKIKQYQDEHKKILKEELKEVKDRGYVFIDEYGSISTVSKKPKGYDKISLDELDKEQLAKILKSAQSSATTKTKEKLFPK